MKNLFLLSFLSLSILNADLPEPYASFNQLNYQPFYLENNWIIINKLVAQEAQVFIDVESRYGEAARAVALQLPNLKIYEVNPWHSNSYSYQQFLSNVIQEGTADVITPIKLSSREASLQTNIVADFIYIDATEECKLIEKISSWLIHLTENGVIAGNHWNWPSVKYLVVTAASNFNLNFSEDGDYWFLQK